MSREYTVDPTNCNILVHLPARKEYLFCKMRTGTYHGESDILNEFLFALNHSKVSLHDTKVTELNENSFTIDTPVKFTLITDYSANYQYFIDSTTNFYFAPVINSFRYSNILDYPIMDYDTSSTRFAFCFCEHKFTAFYETGQTTYATKTSNNQKKAGLIIYPGSYTAEFFMYWYSPYSAISLIKESDVSYLFYSDIIHFDVSKEIYDSQTFKFIPGTVVENSTNTTTTTNVRTILTMKAPYWNITSGPFYIVSSEMFRDDFLFNGQRVPGLTGNYNIFDGLMTLCFYMSSKVNNSFVTPREFTFEIEGTLETQNTGLIYSQTVTELTLGNKQFIGLFDNYTVNARGINFVFSIPEIKTNKEYHSKYFVEYNNIGKTPKNVMTYYRTPTDYCTSVSGGNYKPEYINNKCTAVESPASYNYHVTFNKTMNSASVDSNNFSIIRPEFTKGLYSYCNVNGFSQCNQNNSNGCTDFICQPKVSGTCSDNTHCFSGKCNLNTGNCVTFTEFTPCENNSQCFSGSCYHGYCASNNSIGHIDSNSVSISTDSVIYINGEKLIIPRNIYNINSLIAKISNTFKLKYYMKSSDDSCYIIFIGVKSYIGSPEFNNALGINPEVLFNYTLLGYLIHLEKDYSISYLYGTTDVHNNYYSVIPAGYYSIDDFTKTIENALNTPFVGLSSNSRVFSNATVNKPFSVSINDSLELTINCTNDYLLLNSYPRDNYNNEIRVPSIFELSILNNNDINSYSVATKNKIPFVKSTELKLFISKNISDVFCYNDDYLCASGANNFKCSC